MSSSNIFAYWLISALMILYMCNVGYSQEILFRDNSMYSYSNVCSDFKRAVSISLKNNLTKPIYLKGVYLDSG